MPDDSAFDLQYEPTTGARRLRPGERCSATISARDKWTPVGLFVDEGEEYEFAATGKWQDRTHCCGPEGYDSRKWYMRLVERRRRKPDVPWFALVGAIGRSRRHTFIIGAKATLRMPARGMLFCFPNDVPGFYRNNDGAVHLTTTRVR